MKEETKILMENFKSMNRTQVLIVGSGLGMVSLVMIALQKPRATIDSLTKTVQNITNTATTAAKSTASISKIPQSKIQKYDAIMKTASKFGYERGTGKTTKEKLVKYNKGDCWAMSDYLFDKLKKEGFTVRIRRGVTRLSNDHRWVELYENGKWSAVAYKKYGFHPYFAYTPSVYNVRVMVTS